jgi:hypothetical protein
MRPAVALIELMIAIVIMGIALASVPIMMEKANEADTLALQQEAIMLAATQMSNVATLPWDEEENNVTRNGGYAKFLDVTDNSGTSFSFGRSAGTEYRVGGLSMNANRGLFRRKFYHSVVFASNALGPDAGENAADTSTFDDIDDFNGYAYTISRDSANIDYKFNYSVGVSVRYHQNDITNSNNTGNSTNVKFVTVNVREATTNDTNVSLYAFMTNIGETKILAKVLSW